MKKWIVLVLVALAQPVFAEDTVETVTDRSQTPWLHTALGTGLVFYSGEYGQLYDGGSVGWAMNFSFLRQLGDTNFYVGGDVGLNFFTFDNQRNPAAGTDIQRTSTAIQLLPSMVYRFPDTSEYNVTPYFGFSMGPNVYLHRQRFSDAARGEVSSDRDTKLYFELLARPGADVHLTETLALNVEPKFGLLNWDFIFMPQVALALTL